MPTINDRSELAHFMRRWLSANPSWAWDTSDWRKSRRRSADEVALNILHAMEQEELYLAEWFESPDGELIMWAAGEALSPWAGADLHLFADAVTMAAQARNKNQKVSVLWGFVAVAALSALIVGFVKTFST